MRTCIHCKLEQPISDFDVRAEGRISTVCKSCRRIAIRKHYHKNKAYYIDKGLRNKQRYFLEFNNYKKTLFCTDCNFSFKDFPTVCDFHHLNPATKEFNIGHIVESSIKLQIELSKCIPLCSNCHRIRHAIMNN